jgi:uncharacterized protein with beta-barrel porin domain
MARQTDTTPARRRLALLTAASAAAIGVALAAGPSAAECVAGPGQSVTCSGETSFDTNSTSTPDANSPAVFVEPGASVEVGSGSISTSGTNSHGVVVGEGASVSLGTSITTTGSGADAVRVTGASGENPIELSGAISTSGIGSSGVSSRAADGTFLGGVSVDLSGNLSVLGSKGFGGDVAGIRLGDGASVAVSGGIATVADDVSGISIGQNGSVEGAAGSSIETEGLNAAGILLQTGSKVGWNGSLSTFGNQSQGISAFAVDVTVGEDGSIHTYGVGSHGIGAGSGGTVLVNGSVVAKGASDPDEGIATYGVSVFDVFSNDATAVTVGEGGIVTASGAGAAGINIQKGFNSAKSTVAIDGSVSGDSAGLLYSEFLANGGLDLTVGGTLGATGAGGTALGATLEGSTLNTTVTGQVTATGADGTAILVTGSGTPFMGLPPNGGPGGPAALASTANITVAEGGVVSSLTGPAIVASGLGEASVAGIVRTNLTVAGSVGTGVVGGKAVSLDRGDDVVTLAPTFDIAGNVDAGLGNDELVLGGVADTSGLLALGEGYSFSNFETLRKTGGGSWLIGGATDEAIAGQAYVDAGFLSLAGVDLKGMGVTVGADGTLYGRASGLGSLTVDGVVSPGYGLSQTSRIDVAGPVSFAAGSRYDVDLYADGRSDLIAATGTATLAGGTVAARTLDATTSYTNGKTFEILTAGDGVAGKFDAVTGGSLFLSFTPVYEANRVLLAANVVPPVVVPPVEPPVVVPPVVVPPVEPPVVVPPVEPPIVVDPPVEPPVVPPVVDPRPPVVTPQPPVVGPTPVVFPAVARTYNQEQAARALNGLSQEAGSDALYAFNQVLFSQTADEARAAFDMASGEIHASVQTDLVREATRFSSVLLGRAGLEQETPAGRTPVWTAMSYGQLDHDGDGNAADTESESFNVAVGADVLRYDVAGYGTLTGGVALGYGNGTLESADRRSNADRQSVEVGVYSGIAIGPVGLSSTLSYGRHEIDTERGISFGNLSREASGDYSADTFAASGKAEYRMEVGGATVAPYLTATVGRVETNGGRESGAGALGLDVRGEGFGYADGGIGVRVEKAVTVGKAKVTLRADVSAHKADGGAPSQRLGLSGSNVGFDVRGSSVNEARADIEVGARAELAPGVNLDVSYRGSVGEVTESHAVMAKLGFSF